MEGLRPRQRAWPSRTPTAAAAAAAGSLAASPAPRLPDNPKPTTRPRPRALTRRRGRGRARRRLPPPAPPPLRAAAQSWSPPPRRRPSLRRSPGDCPPVRTSGPRRGPASAEHRRVRPFGSSGLPLPAAPGSRPRLLSHRPPGGARPAARLEGPPRSRPLGPRASAASLPACLISASPGRRRAALCFHGRCVHRGCGSCLWRGVFTPCPVTEEVKSWPLARAAHPSVQGSTCITWIVSQKSPPQGTPLANKTSWGNPESRSRRLGLCVPCLLLRATILCKKVSVKRCSLHSWGDQQQLHSGKIPGLRRPPRENRILVPARHPTCQTTWSQSFLSPSGA